LQVGYLKRNLSDIRNPAVYSIEYEKGKNLPGFQFDPGKAIKTEYPGL
jgi:hypothetical protein